MKLPEKVVKSFHLPQWQMQKNYAYTIRNDLVAWWPFDEDANDASEITIMLLQKTNFLLLKEDWKYQGSWETWK